MLGGKETGKTLEFEAEVFRRDGSTGKWLQDDRSHRVTGTEFMSDSVSRRGSGKISDYHGVEPAGSVEHSPKAQDSTTEENELSI